MPPILRSPARGPAVALEALALPAAELPDVALDLARVDLAAGKVHVRRVDQAPLVALERHPLGEHVVGIRQPRGAVGLGLVRELDAVLVEQAAGLRQVGDDRLVRVDQVGVRDAAQLLVERLRAPDPDEPEVAVHLPLLLVHARAQQLAGALLGATFAAGVVGVDLAALARLAERLAGLGAPAQVREHELPEEGDDDEARDAESDGHGAAIAPRPRRAGRRSPGLRRAESPRTRAPSRPPGGRSRTAPGSRPTCPARAGGGI